MPRKISRAMPLFVVHAAAEHEVVAFASVGEFRADATDVAAVVLRAGVRAAGEVDVDRQVEAGIALAQVCHERAARGSSCRLRRTCSPCCRCRR